MKKQALAIAIASALAAPSAFAAQDTSGMHYTSASEGFYASIRVVWSSVGNAQDRFSPAAGSGSDIGGNWSRFGIRGTNDLGGGLEGFYQYEARVDHQQDEDVSTRLAHVGLRGNFGEIVAGTFWNNLYNFSYGSTDVANNHSGHFVSSSNGGRDNTAMATATAMNFKNFPNRINNAFQYTTPDLNGFHGSFIVVADDNQGYDDSGAIAGAEDKNDIDMWGLAAKYDVQGFSVGATYAVGADVLQKRAAGAGNTNADPTGTEDATQWTVKLGYSQDNWYVNGWYGEANDSERGFHTGATGDNLRAVDTETFSLAGGVTVDKVALYAVYENQQGNNASGDTESEYATFGAQYNLGAQSRVFVEYNTQDVTASEIDDRVEVGLRHDF